MSGAAAASDWTLYWTAKLIPSLNRPMIQHGTVTHSSHTTTSRPPTKLTLQTLLWPTCSFLRRVTGWREEDGALLCCLTLLNMLKAPHTPLNLALSLASWSCCEATAIRIFKAFWLFGSNLANFKWQQMVEW